MNRRIRKHIQQVRDKIAEIDAELDFVDALLYDGEREEPTTEEVEEMANWTSGEEEPDTKAGVYIKDLKDKTELKDVVLVGQIKTVTDVKSYVKKDGGGAGLVYNIVLQDDTGDMICVFWDEMVEIAKKFTIGQYIKITKGWMVKMNKKFNKLEIHPGKYAVIEVVE